MRSVLPVSSKSGIYPYQLSYNIDYLCVDKKSNPRFESDTITKKTGWNLYPF